MGHQQYDDMSPNSKVREEDRKFRNIKRMTNLIIIVLIIGAVGAIAYLLSGTSTSRSADVKSSSAADETIEVEVQLEDLLGEPVMNSSDQTEEQNSLVDADDSAGDTSEESTEVLTSEDTDMESPEEDLLPAEDQTGAESAADAVTSEEVQEKAALDEMPIVPVVFSSYIIQPGDTINRIAQLYDLRPETLIGVNDISDIDEIQVGDELQIPDRDGQMYTVRKGDSLSEIAYDYDMGYVTLAEVNGLTSQLILIGQRLFIPEKTISRTDFQIVMKNLFMPPADGIIRFEFEDVIEDIMTGETKTCEGLYYTADFGSSVVASNAGTVVGIYNDQSGLGRYIVIDHDNGFRTTYGHLDKLFVQEGVAVKQGDRIATVGYTGAVLEPTLYFEIDKDGIPVDPAEFFPEQ